ncbi:amino acid permease [Fructilactobacillus fructivorans]|uniref:Arginine/ornithine antiporter ArcD n=2 Tax=Fructilactobacillus fructivorans TaxID=1614 RepID=A0A0C1M7D9_9LACO|nr:amino acid permease [Fructilactobacillus fructivorans]KID42334.1 Arginine/ornithine antiporter ArcD [Fructilactobacillus fructivorans]KRK58174.1 histidine histamine antiporter [Fructilactobacillus fructivorans]KRN41406.1 histidine histamine antiporter [Fructilactobacillus fructivorans]KRN42577.1 histidine histamine antiporter [Fructilactobacillus fructivorans]
MSNKKEKIGTVGLTAFVLSAMVGGGIYDLPQNMALHAGAIAQIIAWALSGLIIWFIVRSFMTLSEVRPQFTTGLYHYAHAGFGNFTAFFVSWGYWICQSFAVAAYSVLLMSTLNAFWPGTFTGGNNWISILGGTIVLWLMTYLILKGIRVTSHVDVFGTICMLTIVAIFIITMIVVFNWHAFTTNMFAAQTLPKVNDKAMGGLFSQVRNAMMTTMWVFSGVEGAVVLSSNAKSQKDVRQATKYGFLICLVLYALVSILPLGLRSYGQIANLQSPSTGALMQIVLGPLGRLIITFGVIVAVLSSWLTWVLVLSEMPRAASMDGTFPKFFRKMGKNNVPIHSLFMTVLVIQLIIIFTHFAGRAFNFTLTIVGTMTVPPYLISMMYLFKISRNEKTFNPTGNKISVSRKSAYFVSALAILGTLFMGYAAGLEYMTIAFVIYAIGIPLFMYARKQYAPDQPIFGKYERYFAIGILIVAVIGVILLIQPKL